MDISHNHHHHISPVAVVAVLAAAGLFGLVHGGYLKGAFHKEILAKLDPSTILTTTDMVQQERRAIMPSSNAASLH
ncbi:hypothetical protein [Rhizobium sp. NPDC090279]|uniref:hypothetical protein n=1 Tax=Rhizobium sp. NPDC090279 TaxID=3364499 RepID=UPI00383B1D91